MDIKNGLISVVIPLYNGASFVDSCLRSIFAQTYSNFEIIVINDGSTDEGGEIVSSFLDSRLRLINQHNQGVSAARNRGIFESKGKYIAFLDSDDEWEPTFLEAVFSLSIIFPQAGLYGTGYRMVFTKGQSVEITAFEEDRNLKTILITDYFNRSLGGSLIHASGVMIPRRIFEELGVFIVNEHHGEDLEMWARIALHYPIGYDTRILFSFYQTVSTDKPRFQKFATIDPKVAMLHNIVAQSNNSMAIVEVIQLHIKDYLRKISFWYILNTDRSTTKEFLRGNNSGKYLPMMDGLLKFPFLWYLFYLAAILHRISQSRILMKILGGKRMICGVSMKLNESKNRFQH